MINKYLEKIKKHICDKGVDFAGSRDKNARFMREHGFNIDDITDILLDLHSTHYLDGPERETIIKI